MCLCIVVKTDVVERRGCALACYRDVSWMRPFFYLYKNSEFEHEPTAPLGTADLSSISGVLIFCPL